MGKAGGKVSTKAKAAASRRNGKLGGDPGSSRRPHENTKPERRLTSGPSVDLFFDSGSPSWRIGPRRNRSCQEYPFRMSMIDWSACSAVELDPARVSGAWVFRGTRVPVAALFENLEDGSQVS
jgi:hypothetical protein